MTEVKTISGEVLFSYDEDNTTLAEEISKHKNLTGADLTFADLSGADLKGVDLSKAILADADLSGVDLSNADLRLADLRWANLKGANLKGANFRNAKLGWADLSGADLEGADLKLADLSYAKDVPDDFPMACPENGSFIAWKKVYGSILIKLEVPEDAKRCSATTKKCRCNKAKVLEITNMFTGEKIDEVVNTIYFPCTYKVDEMVYPDSFDENRWNECSHGIHFFIDREDAENY